MAGVINIQGITAMSTPDTTCSTFVEEGGYGYDHLSNLYDSDKTITKTRDVKCVAGNCKYNDNGECYADNVQINAANASCGTFKAN